MLSTSRPSPSSSVWLPPPSVWSGVGGGAPGVSMGISLGIFLSSGTAGISMLLGLIDWREEGVAVEGAGVTSWGTGWGSSARASAVWILGG